VRIHVTGSNDAIFNEGCRTTAVFGGGASRPGFALGHSFETPPRGPAGQRQSRVWIGTTKWDWQLSSHKGQWHFYDQSLPRGGIMTLGHDYGLPGTNAGEHSCGEAPAT
jgi:hypothetical protein